MNSGRITSYNVCYTKLLREEGFEISDAKGKRISACITGSVSPMNKALSKYDVYSVDVKSQSLEDIFMHFYGGEDNVQ